MKKIINNNHGEMLLESVLSILMFSLILLSVATMTAISANMNKSAKQMDESYYVQLKSVMENTEITPPPQDMEYKLTYKIKLNNSSGGNIIQNPFSTKIEKELHLTDKGIITLK